ncbi:hypothetical protein PHLGIDRAFT_113602 [Phlebiopsis gigantea 11061_1 CR5-6]|uniref:SnoaL-like domain-containing protein n=1 Tax=Phlebiopsis gigantea (strain 11061_1 CR5-6) TaxID=745531 RepID=A0A0C3SFR0_PHLG1|nr:hypothetical protein PHLGIDRAFT_113602 [Phlebiopsis gigantea 11061_1 CR5-6]
MTTTYPNTVGTITKAPLLVVLCPEDQFGWCKQLAEEGYDVVHIFYDNSPADSLASSKSILEHNLDESRAWALISYGLKSRISLIIGETAPSQLRASIHYCPDLTQSEDLLLRYSNNQLVPTIIHAATTQEELHASVIKHTIDPGYKPDVAAYNPVVVHAYPRVSAIPPFPFTSLAPIQQLQGLRHEGSVDPYIRSAVSLSYTRSLELLRRQLGPHFDLEKLWELHTFYEFDDRDALKTMSTMVATPYVNHIPTMTGGRGYDELARFYKYHFTRGNVTPPDTELITISRTVGADRVIDEMIFKCTHTTEIDYFLPGIKPTGKPLELALVGIIAFRGDKLTFEHIYWDQASALVQLGLLKAGNLPIAGVEVAQKVIDPFGLPSNSLMEKWKESEGLPITDD